MAVAAGIITSSTRLSEATARHLVRSGDSLYGKGKYGQAAALYSAAIRHWPRYGEAYYRLGVTDSKLGNPWSAEPQFLSAIDLLPRDNPVGRQHVRDAKLRLEELYFTGTLHHGIRFWMSDLTAIVNEFIAENERSFEAHKLKGDLAMASLATMFLIPKSNEEYRRDWSQYSQVAIDNYRAAMALRPQESSISINLARALAGMGRDDEAESIYKAVLSQNTRDTTSYLALYRLYMRQGQAAQAEQTLNEGVAQNAEDYSFQSRAAALFYRTGNLSAMSKILEKVKVQSLKSSALMLMVGDFQKSIGHLQEAIETYTEGARRFSSEAWAFHSRMLEAFLEQGDPLPANRLRDQLLGPKPSGVEARTLQGWVFFDRGDLDRAIQELHSTTSDPHGVLPFYYLGQAYLAKGEVRSARSWFLEAAKIRSDSHLASLGIGATACNASEFSECAETARSILGLDPQNVPARMLLITASLGLGKQEEARKLLEQVQSSLPRSPALWLQMGHLNVLARRVAEAEVSFRTAHALDPQSMGPLRSLVNFYLSQNRADVAVTLIESTVITSTNRIEVAFLLAEAADRAKAPEKAVSAIEAIIPELNSAVSRSNAHLRMANIEMHNGDLTTARLMARKAELEAPDTRDTLVQVADVYWQSGETRQSRPLYEKLRKIEPQNTTVLNRLALLLADEGQDLDRAMIYASLACTLEPHSSESLDTLGWVYVQRHSLDSALGIFRELVANKPDVPRYRYHLGACLLKKGLKREAVQALNSALHTPLQPTKIESARIHDLIAGNP